MTKQFNLALPDDVADYSVDGFFSRDGFLVVHKSYPSCVDTGWQKDDGWKVSHVGSGLGIGSRKTRADALELRKLLERLGDRWSFTDPEKGRLGVLHASILELLDGKRLHV